MSFSIAFGSTRSSTNWRTVACTSRCSGVSSKSTTLVYVRPGRSSLQPRREGGFLRRVRKGSPSCSRSWPRRARSPGALRGGPDRDGHPDRIAPGVRQSRRRVHGRQAPGQPNAGDGSRSPSAGARRSRVTKPGIDTDAAPDSAYGVEAHRPARRPDRPATCARAAATSSTCAYEERRSPTRLVVDLWKAKPPSADAEFPTAPNRAPLRGCLKIESFSVDPGAQRPRARSAASSSIRSCSRSATGGASACAWFG